MKQNLVIFFLRSQLAEFFGIIFRSLWNLISNFGSLIEKKKGNGTNIDLIIYFIYLFIYLIFTNFAKRPGTLQIYQKYTTSYSIHADEEQLGLSIILQSQSSKIWCKHSLDWTRSIQQEIKGRVTSAGAIRSNQGFVGGRQNINQDVGILQLSLLQLHSGTSTEH